MLVLLAFASPALANAIITAPDAIPSHTREALKPIIGKYIS